MIRIECSNTPLDVAFLQFSGGERHVHIKSDISICTEATIFAQLQSSNDVMDYLLLENALLNANPALKIHLTLPYLPYARQDRVCATGQAFSLQLMASLLQLHPKASITVWDCHSPVGLALLQARNIPSTQLIAHSAELVALLQQPSTVLVCPDKGAIARSQAIKDTFNVATLVHSEKIRNPHTGHIERTEVYAEDLTNKTAVITDDICDGGATFIAIANVLRQKGCRHIVLYVTHGIFSKGLSPFNGLIDTIYTTNSFSSPYIDPSSEAHVVLHTIEIPQSVC